MKISLSPGFDSLHRLWLTVACAGLGVLVFGLARVLLLTIDLVTQLAFFGRWSTVSVSPVTHSLGLWVILVPVLGGLLVGLMARFVSSAIRGHGIPEAMEQILKNRSRIAPRLTWLKPLSAAISIGTGGPFGAEGPIIASGGALGSLLGQILSTTAVERKILLAAGASSGMTAIFGTPLAALFLSIELLLFEFRARSLIPVSLAVAVSMALREASDLPRYFFPLQPPDVLGLGVLGGAVLIGAGCGLAAAAITHLVYWLEDQFEKIPMHWMWWPALGGIVVGSIGYYFPRTLGVGYGNIQDILDHRLVGQAVLLLCLMKFLSWWVALSSGTSGGTLAPLLTFGAGLGYGLGLVIQLVFPFCGLSPSLAALIGMVALFSGASRAFLASTAFALEATGWLPGAMPVLAGCSVAHWLSSAVRSHSIMTEKIVRRGVPTPSDYVTDDLQTVTVAEVMATNVPTVSGEMTVAALALGMGDKGSVLSSRAAFPVLGDNGKINGLITRGDILRLVEEHQETRQVNDVCTRALITTFPEASLHQAVEKMLRHNVGRLLVVSSSDSTIFLGYLGRREILLGRRQKMDEAEREPGWFRFTSQGTPALRP
jgi:H+/Cl- antiporter ClcA/CBS domain-containing protein